MNKRLFIRACKRILKDDSDEILQCPKTLMIDYWNSPYFFCGECRNFFKVAKKSIECPCYYYQRIKGMPEKKAKAHMLKIIAKAEGK